MKRYEKMTKEDIIATFDNLTDCRICQFHGVNCPMGEDESCIKAMVNWLTEIDNPRIANINSKSELLKAKKKFDKLCHSGISCEKCNYRTEDKYIDDYTGCFINYLAESEEE